MELAKGGIDNPRIPDHSTDSLSVILKMLKDWLQENNPREPMKHRA